MWASNTWVIDSEGSNPTEAASAVVTKVTATVAMPLSFTTVVAEAMAVLVDFEWVVSHHLSAK